MARCRICGEFDGLTFECNYCGMNHCSEHRLPEKHSCHALRRRPSKEKAKKTVRRRQGDAVGSGAGFPAPEPPPEEQPDTLLERLPYPAGRFFELVDRAVTMAVLLPLGLLILILEFTFSRRGLVVILLSIVGVLAVSGTVGTGFAPIDAPVDEFLNGTSAALSSVGNETSTPTPSGAGESASTDQEGGAPGTATTTPASTDGELNQTRIAMAVHEAVNEERRSHQRFQFEYDENLETIAEYHSDRMADEGFFSHTAPDGETMSDRYDRFQYHCNAGAGENIAYTYADSNVASDRGTINHRNNETSIGYGIVEQWMNSEGHRENILRERWDDEGIGVAIRETDSGTRVYVTQNFC